MIKHWESTLNKPLTCPKDGVHLKDWILEVVDSDGNSTVWDSTFETDDLAFKEFQRTVEEEGIDSVVGPPD